MYEKRTFFSRHQTVAAKEYKKLHFFFSTLNHSNLKQTTTKKMNTQFNGGRAWRSSNPSRQLDGLSQPLTRNLQDMSQSQLVELYDKTSTMLNNP